MLDLEFLGLNLHSGGHADRGRSDEPYAPHDAISP
jgi:hypothetical protein